MNIGDYVRTKSYGIAKILNTYNNTTTNYSSITLDIIDCFGRLGVSVGNNDIIKTSQNIIDLIEVGDIVNYEQLNGGVVLNKKEDSIDTWSILPNSLKNEDIKSVITKEQLKNNMYEVGD